MKEIIRIEDLYKTYNMGNFSVHALKGINLTINEGEFVSIMGPSGSGKSTLMNILGCLDSPTSGNYFFNNDNISNLDQGDMSEIRNKKIGFVFQSFNLLSSISSIENVELPLIYNGSTNQNRSSLAHEALKSVGLSDRKDHLPSQLSGGQQQRVAIARAIVNNPDIILADEPTGNLDTENGYEIMNIFKNFNSQGRTIIIITHEDDIASFSKRIIRLRDGEIYSDILS